MDDDNPIDLFDTVIGYRRDSLLCIESYYRAGTTAGAYIMMLAGVAVACGLSSDASEFLAFIWSN